MKRKSDKSIIQNHYRHILNGRILTKAEVDDEIANLIRKRDKGNLDDEQSLLAAKLNLL